MRVIRRLATALGLYGVPITLVLAAVAWFGLRLVRDVDPPATTTTSTAMRPAISPGDLVFLSGVDVAELRPGDVIAHRDGNGELAFGRIADIAADGSLTVTRDNREDDAPRSATRDDVVGRTGARVPLLGWSIVVLRTLAGQVLVVAVCFFGFAGALRARYHETHPGPAAEDAVVRAACAPVPYRGAMSITPAELRHVRFAQVRKGYDTEAVDRALESVADSIEELLHERHELIERVRHLEAEIERYREVEGSLSETLSLAERAAEELKAEAQLESERILAEARAQLAAAQQAAADAKAAPPNALAPGSALPDPAFIELLGETRAIRSLLQALLTVSPQGDGGAPFTPRS